MFTQATSKFYSLDRDINAISSRVSSCESSINRLNNDIYNGGPVWDRLFDIENSILSFAEKLATLQEDIELLTASMNEKLSATAPDLNVKSENPKQKTDLEIFEENDYIDLSDIGNEKGIWELYDDKWYNQ